MAILVSGGAGYIGSHTCVELLAAGYDIVVADNYYNSCPEALARVKKIAGKDFRFVEADMTDKAAVEKIFAENEDIDCVIQLPSNLFYGTSIATCIMVLKKSKTDNKVLFIDASKEFVKVTNSNKLTEENIMHIYNWWHERKDVQYICKLVDASAIAEEEYNLSVSSYVEQEDTREKIDIKVLNQQIRDIVAKEQVLRDEIDRIIADIEEDGDHE